jgi:ubiquitin-activating enzyme E1
MNSDRYDRQNRVYGIENTIKLQNSKVILFGQKCDAMFEIAKNLVLGGVSNISIVKNSNINDEYIIKQQDEYTFEINLGDDLNTEPFLGNVHNLPYTILIKEISALNPYCSIKLIDLNTDIDFTDCILVFINDNTSDIIQLNSVLHNKNKFIVLNFYQDKNELEIVNDFGIHTVNDVDGETYNTFTLTDFINNNTNTILQTNSNHNLSVNDIIHIKLEDGTEFNSTVSKIIDTTRFEIETINQNILFTNGYVNRIKKSVTLKHDTLQNLLNTGNKDMLYSINPVIQSFIGGVIASECVKAITNKYLPFDQKYIFDFKKDIFSRPDNSLVNSLNKLNCLIVGSGAIGCELLKNLAMIGVKNIKITDPDHIENSNLSRQFLFRNEDVGSSKSKVASRRIKEYNNDINIIPFQDKLCSENQQFIKNHFNDTDIVFNALDNLSARLYVDNQIVAHNKPLFESGTQGTKGNTQPIIPNITESYGASQDSPVENEFAACTIKNFPTLIQHTIHYALDDFDGIFCKQPSILKTFLTNPRHFDKIADLELKLVKLYLNRIITMLNSIKTISDYIEWAYCLWYDRFNRRINKLLKTHPKDSTLENGIKFWSNGKKCPTIFDHTTEQFKNYMKATVHLLLNTYKVNITFDKDINQLIDEYDYTTINVNRYIDDIEENDNSIVENNLNLTVDITVQELEKDDDTNYHIAYIQATSNNRAIIYGIPEASFYDTKGIAGKIIPALATTTTIVSSLIVLEMMKYVINNNRPIEDYQSYFINLADNLFIRGEPLAPKKNKINGMLFTEWDNFTYDSDITIDNFIQVLNNKFNIEINMITIGQKMLYSNCYSKNSNENLKTLLLKNFTTNQPDKVGLCVISNDDEIELPIITVTI